MNFPSILGLFARPTQRQARKARTPRIGRFVRMSLEPLEERRLLTVSTAYFHDHWTMVTDNVPTGVASVGDIVNDGGAGGGDGSIAGVYGVEMFGRVYDGGSSSTDPDSDTIADAIAATNSNGTTIVLASAAGEGLALSDPDKTVSFGSTPHTFTLYGGFSVYGLHLTDGTLSVGINDVAQDKIIVASGTINLTGSELNVFFGGTATTGTYTIIENTSNIPITGTFAGLPEDATFAVGERTFQISYTGGYGNDVTLTMVAPTNPFSSFVNDNWHDPGNGVLEVGDTVDDRNDVGGTGNIVRSFEQAAEVDGFQSAAYDGIQDAVDATAPGGAVTILPGSYSGNVVVAKPLAIQGEFTLNGSLVADETTLIVGTGYGTIGVDDLTFTSTSKLMMTASATDSDLIEVDGDLDLGDAELKFQWAGGTAENLVLIDNQGANAVTGTFAGLPEGAEILVNGAKFWITYAGGDGNDVELVIPDSSVADRHLFYNYSRYDGNTTGVSTSDDAAIAQDKSALLPGVLADFTNVSSYSRGINGIMVDITGSHPNITADDLFFEVGIPENVPDVPNNPPPTSWINAPAPATVSVRAGAGTSGSDRVEIIWANEVIQNEWLRVSVLSTMDTGLASPDVFYFGNRVGDSGLGNISSRSRTNAVDELGARNNPTPFGVWEPITNIYDYDRSGRVNAGDENEARNNNGSLAYMTPKVIPPIAQLLGPTAWTPGTDVTLVATAPTLSDGTLDPNVVGIDFYQDVNGNGIFDQDDELMANGNVAEDNLGNDTAWQGTFDPGDLLAGHSSILAVPLNSAGPIGASRSFTGRLPIIIASPLVGGVAPPGVTIAINDFTAVSAQAMANAALNQTLLSGDGFSSNSAGTTLALAAEVGGFANGDGLATATALGYTNVVGGAIGEIIAQASTSAGATAINLPTAAAGLSEFVGAVVFDIVSNAPVGTPVTLIQNVLAFNFSDQEGDNANANASMSLLIRDPDGSVIAFPLTQLNFGGTQVIQAQVGQQIIVNYQANFNLASNISFVTAAPDPFPTTGIATGLQFFQFNVSGI